MQDHRIVSDDFESDDIEIVTIGETEDEARAGVAKLCAAFGVKVVELDVTQTGPHSFRAVAFADFES